jgi:Kef-type K+ transport system membrane component KefB
VGIILAGIKLDHGLSFKEGAEYLQIIFASLFFVSLGVLVDLHEVTWGLIVGFGMAPRGEVAMIVALIGLNQNLIEQETYIVLVLMSLLTTIITPIIFKNWLYMERIRLY